MSARFLKPTAIAALRAIVLAGIPAFLLAALPLNWPSGDGGARFSSALAESGSGSGNSGSGSGNSGSGSGNSGSGSDDDDDEFSGDPTPEGGNLSAEEELLLIQNGWQNAKRK